MPLVVVLPVSSTPATVRCASCSPEALSVLDHSVLQRVTAWNPITSHAVPLLPFPHRSLDVGTESTYELVKDFLSFHPLSQHKTLTCGLQTAIRFIRQLTDYMHEGLKLMFLNFTAVLLCGSERNTWWSGKSIVVQFSEDPSILVPQVRLWSCPLETWYSSYWKGMESFGLYIYETD